MLDFLIDYVKRVTRDDSWWVFEYLQRVAHNNSWWVVAVELLLIGLIVYWLVDFLEGTRGERLFRGVILILVVGVSVVLMYVLVGLLTVAYGVALAKVAMPSPRQKALEE